MEALRDSPLAAGMVALVAVWAITPWVRRLALRCDAVARPDQRRWHEGLVAQWGGLAIFAGVLLAALVWRQPTLQDLRLLAPSSNPEDVAATAQTVRLSTTFFGCGALMLVLGLIDDRFELRPWQKFAGQIAVAALLWSGGIRVTTMPFTAGTAALSEPASLGLTMLWVLVLTNGINFIDGVDGLAAGICAIAAAALCWIEWERAPWAAAAAAAVCGACLGFLRHNFHPARIYLGDSGALLLGFWLSAIALAAASKTVAATTLAIPILVLGIPLIDTAWAIARRLLAGRAPWSADRGHVHHRLLALGLSPLSTTLALYGLALLLALAAVFWSNLN